MPCLCLLAILLLGAEDIYQKAVDNPGRSDDDFARDRTSKPVEILRFSGVEPGQNVLDLFAGGGYYTEMLAYLVGPEGEVTMYNNQAYEKWLQKEIETRLAGGRLGNVTHLVRETDDMDLPTNHFDAVFMVMAFHDLFYEAEGWQVDADELFTQLDEALKPGGTLLVIDHAAEAGTGAGAAQELHRIDEVFARKHIEARGYALVAKSRVLRNPEDKLGVSVFNPELRRRTDRFVYRFEKETRGARHVSPDPP